MIAAARERFRVRGPSQAIVVIAVLATCVLVGVRYVKALSQLNDTASRNSALSFEDREIAGGNSIVVDQRAPYEARALIPPDSPYRVVVGSRLLDRTQLTEEFVTTWLTYFLMPRRPEPDADWVICYGCDSSTLGDHYEPVWQDREGISIGRSP
ncbi:MAG: hypothetical protein V7645_2478 [Actinomycetota bacterium]